MSFSLYFLSDPESESESESVRSPESGSESEQRHHDSATLVQKIFVKNKPARFQSRGLEVRGLNSYVNIWVELLRNDATSVLFS